VGLPLAAPAIAAGAPVVMMETVNDFGAVDYFGVQTLTTGIFSVWLQAGNLPGAAQIAACVLVLVVLLVTLEKLSRNRRRTHASARALRPVEAQASGVGGLGAAVPASCRSWAASSCGGGAVSHSFDEQWVGRACPRAAPLGLVAGGLALCVALGVSWSTARGCRPQASRPPPPVTAMATPCPARSGIGVLIPLAASTTRLRPVPAPDRDDRASSSPAPRRR
jgi:iron(III) transport system permease protein